MAHDPLESAAGDHALRGLKPIQAAPVLEARTRALRREDYHVVLGRQPQVPSSKVIESLCQGLGWDTWSTIRRLEAPTARIIRHESSANTADYWVGWLRELGLVAFSLPAMRLDQVVVHDAVSLTRDNDALIVAASDGTLHRVSEAETLCLAGARLRTRVLRTVQREGKVRREVVRDEEEGTLDVHVKAGDCVLRFRQSALRYSEFLQTDDSGSMALFARVESLVREALPGVRCYQDFPAASGSLGESWRLLVRSREAISRWIGSGALAEVEVTESNEAPLFHLWSLLLRFQHAAT